MSYRILRRIFDHAIGVVAVFGYLAGFVFVCLSPHPFLWGALYLALPLAFIAVAVRRRR